MTSSGCIEKKRRLTPPKTDEPTAKKAFWGDRKFSWRPRPGFSGIWDAGNHFFHLRPQSKKNTRKMQGSKSIPGRGIRIILRTPRNLKQLHSNNPMKVPLHPVESL